MIQPGAHSLPTKLLHATLALAVTYQLAFIGFVERPRNGEPGNLFYQIHQIVGLITLGVVSVFWVWSLVRRGETSWPALFPWFSAARLRALAADVGRHWVALRQFKLPDPEESLLATAVHGLGLLTVTVMAVTGAVFALLGLPKDQTRLVLEIHELFANLMWAYLIGHAGLAVLHQFAGHPVIKRIFGRGAP